MDSNPGSEQLSWKLIKIALCDFFARTFHEWSVILRHTAVLGLILVCIKLLDLLLANLWPEKKQLVIIPELFYVQLSDVLDWLKIATLTIYCICTLRELWRVFSR